MRKHIALTIDEKFVNPCAVTMTSVLEHNDGRQLTFHIVTDGLTSRARQRLSDIAARGGATAEFHEIPESTRAKFRINAQARRITVASYYRLLLAELLPGVDRVVYLDSDLVVLGPLDELFTTPLEGYAVGAMREAWAELLHYDQRLHYPAADGYFNAGVLVMNLRYWRKHDVQARLRQYYADHPERILHNDQDLLNAVVHAEKKFLPLKYNVQDGYYRDLGRDLTDAWCRENVPAMLRPVVLHYTNRKPWEYHCMHPLRHVYLPYMKKAGWGLYDFPSGLLKDIHRFVHLLPYTLGFKRRRYLRLEQLG